MSMSDSLKYLKYLNITETHRHTKTGPSPGQERGPLEKEMAAQRVGIVKRHSAGPVHASSTES